MSPARGPWYISARAVRDYAGILVLRASGSSGAFPWWEEFRGDLQAIASGSLDEGLVWDRLAVNLQRMAEETVASGRRPKAMDSGALRYRGPKPLRLVLVVVPAPRLEGDLPQLVRVLASHERRSR